VLADKCELVSTGTVTLTVIRLGSDSGNRMYIITATRMISGLVLKYLKGELLVMPGR
jgi:hypothetical protein